MRLDGQRALVTGASRGIGRAIALALAEDGAAVTITGRATAELEQVQAAITAAGRECHAVSVDLARPDGAATLWAAVAAQWGGVDILVNNAGVGSSADPKPVVDFDDDFWNLTLYVNLTVPYLLSKYAVAGMIKRGHGRIINIASIAGKVGTLHGAAYAASKHGLLGLTRTLAMEVVRAGVTVNAVCPGPVESLMNDKRIAYDAQRLGITVEEFEAGITPLGRRLVPAEIASMARFLAGPDAAAITGQAYNVDGGLVTA